jgi:hypothetical protein
MIKLSVVQRARGRGGDGMFINVVVKSQVYTASVVELNTIIQH